MRLIVSHCLWVSAYLPCAKDAATICIATKYPQWSKFGRGPGSPYGPSRWPSCNTVVFMVDLIKYVLDDTVDRALLQKASRIIRRIQPMANPSVSVLFPSNGSRLYNFEKMRVLHSNDNSRSSPFRASRNLVASPFRGFHPDRILSSSFSSPLEPVASAIWKRGVSVEV